MIGPMPRPRLPYLQRQTTRHGKTVWYVRVGSGKRTRLREPFGTPGFMREYQAAISGAPAEPASKTKSGTLAWLIDQYHRSAVWAAFSVATRRQRENIFRQVIAQSGDALFKDVTRKAIVQGIDRRRDRPAAARHFLETMKGLCLWALDAEHITVDPTAGVKTPKRKSEGFHVWSEEECAQFERRWPVGTRERLAFDLLLLTGLRRGDAVVLGRQHVRNGVATMKTQKTGESVSIRLPAALLASIAASPCGDLSFIAGERGKPMTKESFGNWFRRACKEAGVPGAAHGLRKAGATRAADAGATEHELMAMFGWAEPRTAAIYTRNANRQKLAMQGADKLAAQTANDLSPHPEGAPPHLDETESKNSRLKG